MSFIGIDVDNDLAFAVSILDLAWPLVQARPFQPRERRSVEMTCNDVADEGRLTITMRARQVELVTTIYGAIAVVVCFTLEFPLVRHRGDPFGVTALRNGILRSCKPSRRDLPSIVENIPNARDSCDRECLSRGRPTGTRVGDAILGS